jgi:phosphate transport system protein
MTQEKMQVDKHIFQRFDEELTALLDRLLEMGGLVEKQVADAVRALIEGDTELASAVLANEEQVDDLDVEIDQMCVRLIAIRQPTASDLRLVLGISKSVLDLERIGDEANKIAKLTLQLAEQMDAPIEIGYVSVRRLGQKVNDMLKSVLDAYGNFDAEATVGIARNDDQLDEEYQNSTGELIAHMKEHSSSIASLLNIVWALRALERIGDHVENLAEHLIYTVKGIDVRHHNLAEIQHQIDRK